MSLQNSTIPLDRIFLLSWIEQSVLSSSAGDKAKDVVAELAQKLPEIKKLVETPQSPPHHAEGPTVESHVVRMLAVLLALTDEAPAVMFEEFAREKDLVFEWASMLETIRSHKAFLSAYAVLHDIGKPECLKLDADQRVHYPGHDRAGAGQPYAYARDAVMRYFELPVSSSKMMTELIRLHMDVLTVFAKSADVQQFMAFSALAGRAGVNKDVFLDLVPACLFLDGVAGSLHSNPLENSKPSHDLAPLIHWYRAEREVMPERHNVRELNAGKGAKLALKKAYASVGLSPEAVFELLGTPIGPVRGEIMRSIQELVEDPASKVDFGEHTKEIRGRAEKARVILSSPS
ncbi:MAG: hypothetical protein WC802_01710 [Patescibacteria group bacterium]|jgi:hypothetical protein